MENAQVHPVPARDPVSGGPLIITELEGSETGITIRGRFEMPRFAQLNADQARFLETFLRCRGMLNSVEKELGISYPTARARLDAVLRALELTPRGDDLPTPPEPPTPPTPPQPPTPSEAMVPPGEVGSPEHEPSFETRSPEELFNGGERSTTETAPRRSPKEILDAIERGEITPEEAKKEAKAS